MDPALQEVLVASHSDAQSVYRHYAPAPSLRPPDQDFPTALEQTWIGDFVYVSNGGAVTQPKFVGAAIALAVVGLAPAVGAAIAVLIDEMEMLRVMAILEAICLPLVIYVWFASRRLVGIGATINRGPIEAARAKLDGKALATYGLAAGLVAQMRGKHDEAAAAYLAVIRTLERPRSVPVPMVQQAYPRAVIALVNLGRQQEADSLLSRIPNAGEYVSTLNMIAQAYASMVSGQTLFPGGASQAEAMAAHFRGVQGCWGGLALAAYGYHQLEDAAACAALLGEERGRAHFDRVAAFLPVLFRWIAQQESGAK